MHSQGTLQQKYRTARSKESEDGPLCVPARFVMGSVRCVQTSRQLAWEKGDAVGRGVMLHVDTQYLAGSHVESSVNYMCVQDLVLILAARQGQR